MNEGGTLYQSSCAVPSKGYWCRLPCSPMCRSHLESCKEEIFGPVLAVQTFRTIEEVIEKANNIPYGLSGGVWTDKGSRIFKITGQLRAGVVWANTTINSIPPRHSAVTKERHGP